ncbi:DgyrCDS3727 [Dimorphilus gyrociliatus]|uniref:DgyrCDS3727 n=1 Tax=Dimorphilus gyrociliatus TaxID=2664684 RepID=A0A7I8VGZ6_9ANNE|nr:DgyrCDS3727 [Dimorphilus gyrociliatus]
MSKILKTHPKSVQSHKDLVLQCLDDRDESIRLRALDLLYGMVNKKNLMEIVKKLMIHMDRAEGSYYRDELLSKIIHICSQGNYQHVTNFQWYVTILVELTRIEGTRHGNLISSQMLDVAIRVSAIREFAVSQMKNLLENAHIFANNCQRNGICEVLSAAAWICGEFSDYIEDIPATIETMLKPKVTILPGHIQSMFVQNILKLFARSVDKESGDPEEISKLIEILLEKLPLFIQSSDLEVQERACSSIQLLKYLQKIHNKNVDIGPEISVLFSGTLNPVAPKAQKKVPVPDGLNLDKWINEPISSSSEDDEECKKPATFFSSSIEATFPSKKKMPEPTEEELARRREERLQEQENNPYYLAGSTKSPKKKTSMPMSQSTDDIPVAAIELDVPLQISSSKSLFNIKSSDKYLIEAREEERRAIEKKNKKRLSKKSKKKKNHYSDEEIEPSVQHSVNVAFDMPEGATLSDEDAADNKAVDDPHRMLDINLDEPLKENEVLPVRRHRIVDSIPNDSADIPDGKKKKKKKKSKAESDKPAKTEKKKKKKKKSASTESNLLVEEDVTIDIQNHESIPCEEETLSLPTQGNKPKDDLITSKIDDQNDMNFWLSNDNEQEVKPAEQNYTETIEVTKKSEKPKKKKKDEKKKKRRKQSDYEIADGITTPSMERVEFLSPKPPSDVLLVASNDLIKIYMGTKVNRQSNSVSAKLLLQNSSERTTFKDMEFTVIDTTNIKLLREPSNGNHEGIKFPFVLQPLSEREAFVNFSISNVVKPQKLKGSLSYITKSSEGSSLEKLDFKLKFDCSMLLIPGNIDSAAFSNILASTDSMVKHSSECSSKKSDFNQILKDICLRARFSIVEKIDATASLYATSMEGHHVCLLIKQMGNSSLVIDGKSNDSSLISNVVSEICSIVSQM